LSKKHFEGETKSQRRARKEREKLSKKTSVVKTTTVETVLPAPVVVTNTEVSLKNSAFVLGNGTSRAPILPVDLKPYGTIYGCNALYREFKPDHLIAVDTKMIKEITSTGYHLENPVWTNPNRYSREIPKLNLFNPNLGWSSGPSALNLASEHNYETIYILGFDYEGIGKNHELVNNVYSGTINYKNINDRATYHGNWTRQTSTCIKKHSRIKYIRVIKDQSSFVPDVLIGLPNLTHVTVEKFMKNFNL
jgi:hypothetical protein